MAVIIGLAGKTGSGKDTAARFIIEAGYAVQRVGFADVLKHCAAQVFDIEVAIFFGIEQKEHAHPVLGKTYRQLLCEFGTKMRDIDPDVWVRWADRTARCALERGEGVIFTDVRYANEVAYIHDMGGHVIEIRRPWTIHPHEVVREHPSENYSGDVDACILNDNTLETFRTRILHRTEQWYGPPSQSPQLHAPRDTPDTR